jgi:hypothetical protein
LTGGTYDISGTLKFAGANVVTNAANLTLSGGSAKLLNSTAGTSGLANFAANAAAGSFSLAGGQSFTTGGTFANAGALSIGSGSTFTVGGGAAFTQTTSGKITNDGTLAASGGVTLSGGSLFGTGTVSGNLTSSGAVTPGNSSTSTGILTDTGTYTQNAAGTLNVVIGGTAAGAQFDELTATTAKLGGTLNLSLASYYVPPVGSTFKILGYNSESGEFATVTGLAINGAEHFALSYQGSELVATVVAGAAGARSVGAYASSPLTEGGFSPGIRSGFQAEQTPASRSRAGADFEVASASGSRIFGLTREPNIAQSRARADNTARLGRRPARAHIEFSFPNFTSLPHLSFGVN